MTKIKFIILVIILCASNFSIHSQDHQIYRVKKKPGKVTLTPYSNGDITMLRISGLFEKAKKVIYSDTINGYEIEIPKIMKMQETDNLYNFCNTIPRENGRDNAICINSAPKKGYESLDDFKKYIIEDPKYLNHQSWLWGEDSELISIEKEVFNSYDSYKVLIRVDDRKLLGQFIILETTKSYLWINFVADENTFDDDLNKFSDFLVTLKILD